MQRLGYHEGKLHALLKLPDSSPSLVMKGTWLFSRGGSALGEMG